MHAETFVFAVEAELGDVEEMLPQRAITRSTRLQFGCCLARFIKPRFVRFAGRGRGRIDGLQIVHRHRRGFGIGAGERRVEVDGRDAAMLDFGDQLAHLQAPVAKVHVARHRPAVCAVEPLQAVADDSRPQMADMHRLGDVRPAEIDDKRLALARLWSAETRVPGKGHAACGQRSVGDVQIDEAGTRDLDLGEQRIRLQARRNLVRNRTRIGLGLFGGGERTVALELCEVGTIRPRHLAERRRQTLRRERGSRDRTQLGAERAHGAKRPIFLL